MVDAVGSNPAVERRVGSSPSIPTIACMTEWSNVAECKSVFRWFESSYMLTCGNSEILLQSGSP